MITKRDDDDDAFSKVNEKMHLNDEKVPFGGIGAKLQKNQEEEIYVKTNRKLRGERKVNLLKGAECQRAPENSFIHSIVTSRF